MRFLSGFSRGSAAPPPPPTPLESSKFDPLSPLKEEKGGYFDVFSTLPTLSAIPHPIDEESESDNAALDVVADMLYRSCWPLGWVPFKQVESDQWMEEVILGVSIRAEDGTVRSCPAEHDGLRDFEHGVGLLHATTAMKITCKSVEYMVKFYL